MRQGIISVSIIAAFALVSISSRPLAAQSSIPSAQTPVSNPQAVSFASRSLGVLTGATEVSDVTLTGTATRTAGSDDESGSVTLKALGTTNSRMDLSLSNATFSEIRTWTNNAPQGVWLGPSDAYNAMAADNCLTDAVWFFPALSVLSQLSNPNLIANYVGQETRGQESVLHLQFFLTVPTPSIDPFGRYSKLTTEDLYLDSSSLLPVALAFNTHPDNNALINIPVEVDFSNYETVSGVQVPFHIQQLKNGTLFLDLTIQNASVNSGLTESAFSAY